MRNKKVIVTGVLGGVGEAIAKIFANNDWYVIGVDIKSITKHKRQYFINECYKTDISQRRDVYKLYEEINSKHQKVNCIVNNAAVQVAKKLIDISEDDWDYTFATNVKSIYLLAKYFYSLLVKGKGNIVNISSVHAIATSKNIAAYAASKGAILALTRAMALEFAQHRIRVNTVLPGAIDTPMLRSGLRRGHLHIEDEEKMIHCLEKKHPLSRIGKTEDIAELVFFLADNRKASFITGQAFVADGGATIHLSTE